MVKCAPSNSCVPPAMAAVAVRIMDRDHSDEVRFLCVKMCVCLFVCRGANPRKLKAEHALLGAVCGGTKSGWRQYPLQLQEGQYKCNTQGTICSQHKFISHKGCKLQCFLSEQEALVFLFVSVCVGWIPSTSLAISRPQYKLVGSLQTQNQAFPKKQDIEGHVNCRPEYDGARLVC